MKNNYFKKKNDYSCSVYHGSRQVAFMMYVHDIRKFMQTEIYDKNIDWSVVNIYVRRQPRPNFLKRIYRANLGTIDDIERFPQL